MPKVTFPRVDGIGISRVIKHYHMIPTKKRIYVITSSKVSKADAAVANIPGTVGVLQVYKPGELGWTCAGGSVDTDLSGRACGTITIMYYL